MGLKSFKKVFSSPRYVAIAIVIAVVVFSFSVLLPNLRLVFVVITSSSVSFTEAIGVIASLFLSIGTNFTALSASYTIAIAVFFGINIALLIYYISITKNTFQVRGSALGVGGLISGIFGIGCAACGTFILTSVLALVGAAGIVSFLPFGGEEFGVLGVILIGYSTYWTSKKIGEPLVCKSD